MEERTEVQLDGVKALGSEKTEYKLDHPHVETLETFENKHPDVDYLVSFKCPEFTSLCPKTGQPDLATIHIQYIPDVQMVESKSLKLYLFSFRNHGDFHEDCTVQIMKDLKERMNPKWIRVVGDFTPRGGISICPVSEYCKEGFHVPSSISNNYPMHTRHL